MSKKGSTIKTVLLILLIFIVVPVGTFFIVYKTNSSFRDTTNKYLKNVPGVIGEYANTYPTDLEKNEKINYIADYYLSLSKENASDKLYGIKKDSEELYFNIIQSMQNKSPYRTEDIIKILRNREIKKDLMVSIYDGILKENDVKFNEEVKRYSKLGVFTAAQELEEKYIKANKSKEAAKILSSIDAAKSAQIIRFLTKDEENLLFSDMSTTKKNDIVNEMISIDMKKSALVDKAKIYETKDPADVFNEIGSTANYRIDELAQIYKNLSIEKAGQVLSYNKDKQFYNDLMDEIRKDEGIKENQDSVTIDISKVMNFYNKNEKKVNELIGVYEKMNSSDLAKIVDRMIVSNNPIDTCSICTGDIKITDSQMIVDVLEKISKNTLSDVLNQLEPRKATEIIRKLSK